MSAGLSAWGVLLQFRTSLGIGSAVSVLLCSAVYSYFVYNNSRIDNVTNFDFARLNFETFYIFRSLIIVNPISPNIKNVQSNVERVKRLTVRTLFIHGAIDEYSFERISLFNSI